MKRKVPGLRGSPQPGVSPQIFVKIGSDRAYAGYEYVKARIQVRRARYRYLVWWERGQKRELYLGAVKSLPLSHRSPAPAIVVTPGARVPRATGVRKLTAGATIPAHAQKGGRASREER